MNSPHIFIGVGAWGHAVLDDLRAQIAALHGGLQATPHLGWLWIDFSDSFPATTLECELAWKEEEKIALDFESSEAGAAWNLDAVRQNSPLGRVLGDPGLRGDSGIRGRARFGLWSNWASLETALRHLAHRVTLGAQTKSSFARQELCVTVVAHLGEATGGGIASDLGLALRELLERIASPFATRNVIGVLGLPSPASSDTDLARAYAALRELNHWNDQQNVWSARGPAHFFASQGETPVFDFAFLWASDNAGGVRLSEQETRRAVSQWLGLELHPTLAQSRAAQRALLRETPAFDEWGHPTRYHAAGVASLEFPREALSQACAALGAQKAWQHQFFPVVDLSPDRIISDVATWMREVGFDALILLETLFGHFDSPTPTLDFLSRWRGLSVQWEDQWRGNAQSLRVASPETVEQQARAIAEAFSEDEAQKIDEAVSEVVNILQSHWGQNLATVLRANVLSSVGGAVYAKRFLEMGAARFAEGKKTIQEALVKNARESEAQHEEYRATLHSLAPEELRKCGGLFGRGVSKRQNELVDLWTQSGASLTTLRLEKAGLRALLDVWGTGEAIWKKGCDDANSCLERAREGEAWLRTRAQNWQNDSSTIGQMLLDESGSDDLRRATLSFAPRLEFETQIFDLWREVGALPASPAQPDIFVALMRGRETQLAQALHERALSRARPFFERVSVLELFDAAHTDSAHAAERVQSLFRSSEAFFPLSKTTVVPGWNPNSLRLTARVAFQNAGKDAALLPAQERFADVLASLGVGKTTNERGIVDLADGTRVVFWNEVGGFPLRTARELVRDLQNAFDRRKDDPHAPLYVRDDVAFWLPISAPSPQKQETLWAQFLVGLSLGCIEYETATEAFALRVGKGELRFLGKAPNLRNGKTADFLLWRSVLIALHESDLAPVLETALKQAQANLSPREWVERVQALLKTLEPSPFLAFCSQTLGHEQERIFAPRRAEVERQLARLRQILADPSHSELFDEAHQKQQELQTELRWLDPAGTPAELDKKALLKQLLA